MSNKLELTWYNKYKVENIEPRILIENKELSNSDNDNNNDNIDTNTNTNVKITSDPLKITDIIKLGKQIGIVKDKDIKDYSFTGGIVTVLLDIKGNFKNGLCIYFC